MYIYREKERDREREENKLVKFLPHNYSVYNFIFSLGIF